MRLPAPVTAAILCGIAGLAGGIAVSTVLADRFDWVTVITGESMLIAFACTVATGLVSGIWPAWRAAYLNPVDALRHA